MVVVRRWGGRKDKIILRVSSLSATRMLSVGGTWTAGDFCNKSRDAQHTTHSAMISRSVLFLSAVVLSNVPCSFSISAVDKVGFRAANSV